MKTLSVLSQFAYQIAYGVKNVENRTWKTPYRGKLLIHASGNSYPFADASTLPEALGEIYKNAFGQPQSELPRALQKFDFLCSDCLDFLHLGTEEIAKMTAKEYKALLAKNARKYGYPLRSQAIVGEVDLVDIVKDFDSPFAEKGKFHWILENPVFFSPQVYGVKGHLRLWDFELPEGVNRVVI